MSSCIVHIGFGAFHRAHQLVYAQRLKNSGGTPWDYCEVSLNRTSEIEALREQGHKFHVLEQDGEGNTLVEVEVVRESLHPKLDGPQAIADKIADPDVRVISFTVTEKAYCVLPGSPQLDLGNPSIQADLNSINLSSEATPAKTIFGYLAQGLLKRKRLGTPGVTLLSCDNLASNGKVLRSALIQFCQELDTEFAAWVEKEVSFPCSMIDRIVPKMHDESFRLLHDVIGEKDHVGVVCEAFSQWVIEDKFPYGRPEWETAGAQFVQNVEPFEEMKLRMLNGAHSFIAYAGACMAYETVSDFMEVEAHQGIVRNFMLEEQAASLSVNNSASMYEEYADALIRRFQNPNLHHKLQQIAMDGSQKIPQRIVPALLVNHSHNRACDVGVAAIAIWLYFVTQTLSGKINSGDRTLSDPLSDKIRDILGGEADEQKGVERALLSDLIFSREIRDNNFLIQAIVDTFEKVKSIGVESYLATLCYKNSILTAE